MFIASFPNAMCDVMIQSTVTIHPVTGSYRESAQRRTAVAGWQKTTAMMEDVPPLLMCQV